MIWKEIKDFPGYFVSDTGEIKSTKYWGQFKRQNAEGCLKQRIDRYDYRFVNLYKDGKMYSKKVHRLVAEAFIPNPNNLPQINHINEDKNNNCVSNLEWCTARYNLTHNGFQKRAHLKQKRKIAAYKNGKLFLQFDSATDAALYILNEGRTKNKQSCISNICTSANGDYVNSAYGFYWIWQESSHRK